MKIILFTHPSFLSHQSMPKFAKMIIKGMAQKGHDVIEWSPKALFFRLAFKKPFLEKWFGYIDQFLVFPIEVKLRLFSCSKETLFVFADNALGPWVPLVSHRLHVVHCHDFLAQQSVFGLIPENKTGRTGKYYQKFIRWGYRKSNNFISISKKTQTDLHLSLTNIPKISRVVYNGMNQNFKPIKNLIGLRESLSKGFKIDLSLGYILHVGGNAFYKNKLGVIEIFDQWAHQCKTIVPLILVGEPPSDEMIDFKEKSLVSNSIHFIKNIDDLQLQSLYQGASVMLFPSLYEGFGWPILEAMASGTLVITTDENPMREVAGSAGFYIPKKPFKQAELIVWKSIAANELEKVMRLTPEQGIAAIQESILRSKEFSAEVFIDSIEEIYLEIVDNK